MSYRGMDGLKRNLVKLREEFLNLRRFTALDWKRWLRKPWDLHAYVNLYVESRRVSPYFTGHIDAILYPILVALVIFL